VLIVSFFYNAVGNLLNNIESRGIHTGFDFLGVESGFDIAEHLIDYSSTSSNLRVFYVGLVNTIVVSVVGIIFASIIGLVIGIARLSNNCKMITWNKKALIWLLLRNASGDLIFSI
jgi:general L-amino acid transport system permease protein